MEDWREKLFVQLPMAKEYKTTHGALHAVIRKYQRILKLMIGNKIPCEIGRESCALCQSVSDCSDCPINFISKDGCSNTPYDEFYDYWKRLVTCIDKLYRYEDMMESEQKTMLEDQINRNLVLTYSYAEKELAWLKMVLRKTKNRKFYKINFPYKRG